MKLDFRFIVDEPTGESLERVFESYWPAYRRWIRRSPCRDVQLCVRQLREHMPELIDLHQKLVSRCGGSEEVARFLTLYEPPRVVRGCTQLVIDADGGPTLLRSYDHHPRLFDGILLASRWVSAPTLAMTDCLWGALDGLNEHGLAIALAFGGRNVVGRGFAASLVCRYVLETCATVAEARDVLSRIPVYMPYTFVVVDASGDFITAFVGPDRPASFIKLRASTNHQGHIEWPEYARFSETMSRLACAESLLGRTGDVSQARAAFLQAPLWRQNYAAASATLYVAEYQPGTRSLTLHWPGREERFGFGQHQDRSFTVDLLSPVPG